MLNEFFGVIIWTFFAIISLTLLGFNFTSLAVVAGGLSVGIGLGFQALCGDLLGGIFLMMSETINKGDLIEVDGVRGKVTSIELRSTVLETLEKATIYIPNYTILSGKYINWSKKDNTIKRKITIMTPYNVDIDKVTNILKKIYDENITGISKKQEKLVSLQDFGEHYLIFAVFFNIDIDIDDISREVSVLSDIRIKIEKSFRKENVTFYSPILGLTLDNSNEFKEIVEFNNQKTININKI
jgi:small-conductance mechanosensitive channel